MFFRVQRSSGIFFSLGGVIMFTHVVFQGPEKFWYIFLLGGVIMFFHVFFHGPEKFWYIFLLGGVIMFTSYWKNIPELLWTLKNNMNKRDYTS
jgi:lipid-A-disaccharide synthase-like uncharacterized protein